MIVIDDHDKRPPFEQISAAIVSMITDGTLEAGARLAPIRQLAGDLGIAPNTVARAYRELEAAGFVVSRGRRGTIVADTAGANATSGVIEQLRQALDKASQAGLSKRDVMDLVNSYVR